MSGSDSKDLVHVVDDDVAAARSLDFLLATSGYRVQRWETGDAFLKGAIKMEPACVILDMRMPGRDGLQVQADMLAQGFNFPVIMLTGHGDITLAVRAMQAGALDFLEKPVDREKLLRSVDGGFRRLRQDEAEHERAEWAKVQIAKLTARERDVLEGLACGYPNKTIAFDLNISARTVEVYRANLMTKMKVVSFAEVLRIAFAAGLGDLSVWRHAHPGTAQAQPSPPTS